MAVEPIVGEVTAQPINNNFSYLESQISNVSASPRGVYATLSDLLTALPNGANGIYIVSADGKWYYWSGSSWTVGGTYQSTGLANNSVTYEKADFVSIGKNLFDDTKRTVGFVLNETTGTISPSSSYDTSDYIPVTAGVTTAITNCRKYVLYDNSKTFKSGVDVSTVAPKTVTPSQNGYLRVSFRTSDIAISQVEIGTSNTSYEPFGMKLKQMLPFSGDVIEDKTITKNKLADNSVQLNNVDFVEDGPNLFNKNNRTIGYLLNDNLGNLVPLSSYDTSDYTPVFAGTTYVCSPKIRKFLRYDIDKKPIPSTFIDANVSNYSFTPDKDGYVRASLFVADSNIFQIEKGSVPSSFSPYYFTIADLGFDETQKEEIKSLVQPDDIKIVKTGEKFEIISKFDDTKDINIETNRSGSSNGSFNFVKTTVGSDVIHSNGDDITPIRTFTTVGANHGYTTVVKITMANHGKVTADLGSRWTDGTTTYTLLDISGDTLTFGCPYTVIDGVVSSVYVAPVATLTHVSGATNTGNIAITTINSSPQLYPSINKKSVKYILDEKEITSDGTYTGKELQVQESYNVMDYKAIIDFAQSNVGVSYKNDSIAGVVNLSIIYTFTKGGKCLISHTFKPLQKVTIASCGFLQSDIMSLSSHNVKRYMPNVKTKGSVDFKNIVDMTSYNTSLSFTPSDYVDATKPPNRYVDWLKDANGVAKVGFTMGYITDKTNSKNSDRATSTPTGWDMRNTKKSYPFAMSGFTLNPGEYKTFMGYRNYLSSSSVGDATNINIVRDKRDAYVYIDYHKPVTAQNIKLSDFVGKEVNVIDSENFTLLNDVVDSDGVTFTISSNYGYAILKIS